METDKPVIQIGPSIPRPITSCRSRGFTVDTICVDYPLKGENENAPHNEDAEKENE